MSVIRVLLALGRYAFTRLAAPGLRQRDPHTDDEDDDGRQD
ncbi:hypothetical protein [Dactylosporangium darangshiense]|uniref:Uncharacterized protein n=1 Tax=Dactylosporangium darangshiense TaxID=579108 RepID=A0ABP8DVR1_9ACTN